MTASELRQRIAEIDHQLEPLKAERARLVEELIKADYYEQQERIQRESEAFTADLRAWQNEQGYLDLHEYGAKYGLHWREIEAGVRNGVIVGNLPPTRFVRGAARDAIGSQFFADVPPTDQQRATMREQTFFGRGDAALYLGISEKEFDKRRKTRGLQVASRAGTSSGHLANLYRLSDLDMLR